VPLSALQSTLLKLLASQRSPESYVAGGSALNRQGPRRSQDIDPPDLHRRIRAMIEDARTFLSILPTDEIGVIFLENGYAVQPDPTRISQYVRRHPAPRGYWPSSSEIGTAMLERHRDTD
jgi:hypothetical protein